jgi:hypothetical protein
MLDMLNAGAFFNVGAWAEPPLPVEITAMSDAAELPARNADTLEEDW